MECKQFDDLFRHGHTEIEFPYNTYTITLERMYERSSTDIVKGKAFNKPVSVILKAYRNTTAKELYKREYVGNILQSGYSDIALAISSLNSYALSLIIHRSKYTKAAQYHYSKWKRFICDTYTHTAEFNLYLISNKYRVYSSFEQIPPLTYTNDKTGETAFLAYLLFLLSDIK